MFKELFDCFRSSPPILFGGLLLVAFAIGCSGKEDSMYGFDGTGIAREALERYLDRAVTMAEFLTVDPFCNDGVYPDKERDIELIVDIGAKFIGRAIYRWGDEVALNDPRFLGEARDLIRRVHALDSEVIFQACLFEAVTQEVDVIPIPKWVFLEFDLPVEDRCFRYRDMLNGAGRYVDHWEPGHSVPDLSRIETQLWFLYLAGVYIDIGCEALHLGQVQLIGMADPELSQWSKMVARIRDYAFRKARRGWVLIDAHVPDGGMIVGGKSLLDFNSFPLRIKEIPEEPQRAMLEKGHLDAFYGRSKGAVTPSGWVSDALPYLVEFDNYGVSEQPGVADTSDYYVWGYDEVTWFYLQEEEYRKEWLRYAHDWVRKTDSNGYLQMPVCRILTTDRGQAVVKCHANTRTETFPQGYNLEKTIKGIWTENQ